MSAKLGRFSDAFSPKERVEKWREAEKYFTEKNYIEAYKSFFDYINNADNSVKYTVDNGALKFEIRQGSTTVRGTADNEKVEAEADIARFEKTSVAFMRRLLESNYSLFYSKFSLKEDRICMNFFSTAAAGHPRKLYYGLKETATRSDKNDEILLEDFSMLKAMPDENKQPLPQAEIETKYKYFLKWINDTLARIDVLNQEKFSGAISFLLLDLLYKIDTLIVPQGILMNELEKMNLVYYAKDNKPYVEKNMNMYKELKKLAAKPKEEILKEFYSVKSTFSIVEPTGHVVIADTIKNEIEKTYWYKDNNYPEIALTILEFIPTKCFFSYGMPDATAKLFLLSLNILNQEYFAELGYPNLYYNSADNTFNQILISEEIAKIIEKNKVEYPNLKFDTNNLKYDSLSNFIITFFKEIEKLEYKN